MIIHEKFSRDKLTEWDLRDLQKYDLDEVWYSYRDEGYDGSGQLIARKGELYDHHDMGHCSCYGCIERFEFNGQPLPNLINQLRQNEWYWKDIKSVLEKYELFTENNLEI